MNPEVISKMKNQPDSLRNPFFRLLAALAGLAVVCQTASATVAFTLTPAAISNSYSGKVTLQVTGLPSAGETVVVQKYLDANGDGIIDAGDFLVQQFSLTDGQPGMVIGGVTNFNVPGDTDSVTGQITTKLNLATDFSQLITGNYLFKLSSPSGFVTNTFAVTNFPYAQKFTGTVLSNGVAVPYAGVLLFPASSGNDKGNPVGGAVANGAGIYTLPAPAGTYELLAFRSNFVAGLTGSLVLGSGATVSTNLSLIAATTIISGRAVDASNLNLGLPGLLVVAQNKSQGLIAINQTDTNGNFSVGVTANSWQLESESAELALLGYVGLQNKPGFDTSTGSVSGVSISLPKATGLVYGTVKDIYGNPLTGVVAVYAADQNNGGNGQYQADGYTDAGGNYVVGVVGGLGSSDVWQVDIDNSSSYPNDNFSQPLFNQVGGTNIVVGQALPVNFTALPASNQITGNVKFSGTNLAGLNVYANTVDTNNFQAQATTDSGGNFTLVVGNGAWYVSVNCQGDNNSLQSILGNASYACPCGPTITIAGNNSTGNNIVVPASGSGQIFGYLTNSSGGGISGVTINLQNECTGQGYSTSTAGNGYYSTTVPYGNYNVNVDCGGLNSAGYLCVNSTNATLASASLELNFTAQSNGSGSPTLSGYVQNNLGSGVVGVTVSAGNGLGASFSTTTDNNGHYQFSVGNGTWDVSVSCSGLNTLGYACVSDEVTNINSDTAALNFIVQPGSSATPLAITTTSLPGALVGAVYSQQLNASGGQAPYVWRLDPGSLLLPPGVLLSTNGVISGTLNTNDLGTNYFLVDVVDNLGHTANQFLSLTVYPVLTIATNALPSGTVGTAYSAQVLVSGGEPYYLGSSPDGYTAYLPSGTLPPGLNLSYGAITSSNEYFVISGNPTATGTYPFTLGAIDADANEVQANYSITIVAASLSITTSSLSNATVGVAYSMQLAGSGGATPYTWTIPNGSQQPPTALSLATNGLLSGVPAASGTNSFFVRLTDHNGLNTTHSFTLVTNPKPQLSAAVRKSGTQFQFLIVGATGQNYTLQFATNLASGNWTSLFTTNNVSTNAYVVADSSATNQQRYYRVLIGP